MITAVKERPILFSAPMIKAILQGSKKQTRRVIKPQPDLTAVRVEPWDSQRTWIPVSNSGKVGIFNPQQHVCPYGQAGDRLWVRETWCVNPNNFKVGSKLIFPEYLYRSDSNTWQDSIIWKPSIHMPRAASRITLEVLSVRVERLQDISEEDAIAEGITDCGFGAEQWQVYGSGYEGAITRDPRYSFQTLWNSINSDRGYSWDSNPWVWCVEFKKVV